MAEQADFAQTITAAYAAAGKAISLGRGVHEGVVHQDAVVQVPLSMMNRHGLVAGATGTGKTKTLQGITEQLSAAGVPVFVADVKGDLSGLLHPGDPAGPAGKRDAELVIPYEPTGFPVELLSIGGLGPGVPIRATVSDFGPQLLAKILGANETQESSLTLVVHYADQKALPLLDLADLRALLTYLDSGDGKAELHGIGGLAKTTVGVLLRDLVALETGGGNEFFGEPQWDIADFLRTAPDGRGVISCLELTAVQDKPKLFSTVLMWLVAELFETLPEEGDVEQPKLVFFFDEAHLLFNDASKAFLESVSQTVRLIRSKGVGVFFVTQTPEDVPSDVLGQLGNRVQHALRAFTPDDQAALSATVKTFPRSDFYDLEELLTQMGIGDRSADGGLDGHEGRGRTGRGRGQGRRAGRRERAEERAAPAAGHVSRRDRRLPRQPPGQAAAAGDRARRLRDAEEEALIVGAVRVGERRRLGLGQRGHRPDVRDPLLAHPDHERDRRGVCGGARRRDVHGPEDRRAAGHRSRALDLHDEALERVLDVTEVLAHPLMPAVGVLAPGVRHADLRPDLDVLGQQRQRAIDVTDGEGGEGSADDVDVVHRRSGR